MTCHSCARSHACQALNQQICATHDVYWSFLADEGRLCLFPKPDRTLWTFNPSLCQWTQRFPSGDHPSPQHAVAQQGNFTVVGDYAYLFVAEHPGPDGSSQLRVYRLDLTRWHWQKLPPQNVSPPGLAAFASAAVEVNPTTTDLIHKRFVKQMVMLALIWHNDCVWYGQSPLSPGQLVEVAFIAPVTARVVLAEIAAVHCSKSTVITLTVNSALVTKKLVLT